MAARLLTDMLVETARVLTTGETGAHFIPSGIPEHDSVVGGWEMGCVSIIAARPEVGKTTASVHCVASAAKAGHRVLWFSTEDPPIRSCQKIIAWHSGAVTDGPHAVLNPQRFASYQPPDWADNIAFSADQNLSTIVRDATRSEAKLIVVDFSQNLITSVKDRSSPQHGDEVIYNLKRVAANKGCAVLLMSQINREGAPKKPWGRQEQEDPRPESKIPTREQMKGSGALEEGAKCVVVLHRDFNEDPSLLFWSVQKASFARYKPTIRLRFIGDRSMLVPR